MYFIYIIRSSRDNKYYVGSTNNVVRRVEEHNKGLSKYTKNNKPWVLMYEEGYKTLSEARKREKQIKSWKKREAIERLFRALVV